MTTPREHTLQTPLGNLAALSWGSPNLPPILAVHGWMDNAASFARLAPLLTQHHIVAIDLPGHGKSPHRDSSSDYHFVDWVAHVHAAIDALQWQRPTLLGHSMGAGVLALYAGTLPERAERLIMIEGLGPLTTSPKDSPERLASALRASTTPRKARTYPTREDLYTRLHRANPSLSETSVRLLIDRVAHTTPDGVQFGHDTRLRRPSRLRFTEEHIHAFFARITCPTLILRASHGIPASNDLVQQRLAPLRDVRVETLQGHHHIHLDSPDETARILQPFLNAQPPLST